AGMQTCGRYPGSAGHETTDAETFVEWGVDYLKYDNCNNDGSPEQEPTKNNKTQIFYSICEWGRSKPWLWGPGVGNSWRTTDDIKAPRRSPSWQRILSIIDTQANITQYGGPGGWNDPDMLVVGFDTITFDEQVTHYALWAAMKAPLILGYPLGKSVCLVYNGTNNESSFNIWTGSLSDGYVASNIMIRDLVKQTNIRNCTTDSYTAENIPSHGIAFLKLIGGNVVNDTSPCLYDQ
ncbi:1370_t:CDS:2, partial [Racocetra persica]